MGAGTPRSVRRAGAALLALLVAPACDASHTPPARSADRASTTATSSDTVVRRVVRYVTSASAIQRVTGAVSARRAGETLDSVLAIRILDVRGDELAGVRVDWRLRAPVPGARLTVENEVTDSAGVSRARFRTGSSASAQVVS